MLIYEINITQNSLILYYTFKRGKCYHFNNKNNNNIIFIIIIIIKRIITIIIYKIL